MMTDGLLLPVAPVWMLRLSWALVGGAVVWCLLSSVVQRWQARRHTGPGARLNVATGLALVVAWLACWPQGGWSAYAALGFQSPSVLSLVWALGVWSRATHLTDSDRHDAGVPVMAWYLLCLLGWGLVLDTLNLWPAAWDMPLYAVGFSALGVWISAGVLLVLAWRDSGAWRWQAVGLLLVYVVLRWPSGNVWDAWLDPAVWVWAHVQIVRDALTRLSARRTVRP